ALGFRPRCSGACASSSRGLSSSDVSMSIEARWGGADRRGFAILQYYSERRQQSRAMAASSSLKALLELVALNLARGAPRELLERDEDHLLRLLVSGELRAAARVELLDRERRIASCHECHGHLAPLVVLATHDRGVRHAGVGEQYALDLGGVDVFSARLHEVL